MDCAFCVSGMFSQAPHLPSGFNFCTLCSQDPCSLSPCILALTMLPSSCSPPNLCHVVPRNRRPAPYIPPPGGLPQHLGLSGHSAALGRISCCLDPRLDAPPERLVCPSPAVARAGWRGAGHACGTRGNTVSPPNVEFLEVRPRSPPCVGVREWTRDALAWLGQAASTPGLSACRRCRSCGQQGEGTTSNVAAGRAPGASGPALPRPHQISHLSGQPSLASHCLWVLGVWGQGGQRGDPQGTPAFGRAFVSSSSDAGWPCGRLFAQGRSHHHMSAPTL